VTPAAPFADMTEAIAALDRRAISATELARICLARAAAMQPQLNAFVAIEAEEALRATAASDARRARGEPVGALGGVPVGYKDMFYRAGKVCGCGSSIRANWVAEETATVVTRLEAAGAVPLGRMHMTEFAAGPTGHNEHLGPCRNPWNTERITGGSSSGPGAGLAAGLVLGALGSDTGGSVRLPAALCGVTALFPTRGRISRAGVMPLSPSMDAVGPMARSARDCALLFGILAGEDPADATTLSGSEATPLPRASFAGLRVGVPRNHWAPAPAPDVAARLAEAHARMAEAGAEIVEIDVPLMAESLALGGTVSRAEMASAHRRWLAENPAAYGRILRFRVGIGLAVPAVAYVDAVALRARVTARFLQSVFSRVDVLCAPAFATGAPSIASLDPTEDNLETAWTSIGDWTRPFNYLGVPALALPCGFSDDGLPVGMQLIGRHHEDEWLLSLGIAWQEMSDWHRRRPPEPMPA